MGVWRDPKDVPVTEFVPQLGGSDCVEVVAGGEQQSIGDLLELCLSADRVDHDPAAVGVEAGIACGGLLVERPDPHPDRDPAAPEGGGDLACPGMSADDQHQPAPHSGHPERTSDPCSSEPVDENGAEDGDEDDRKHLVSTGDAFLCQFGPERRRRRSGDDPARRHPRDERPLAGCERRAQRRQSDRRGPDEQDHDRDQPERLRHHRPYLAGRDGCGDEHKQHADEELDERLLELDQRAADVDAPLIGHDHSEQDRCEQARVLADQIRGNDHGDDDHQGRGDDQSWGGSMHLAQQKLQRRRGDRGNERADGEVEQHRAGLPALPRTDCNEDDDAEEGADRVDECPLPLQEGTDLPGRADEGQQRQHDGRARDDEDRADEECGAEVHAVVEQGDGRRDREPGEGATSEDKTRHRLSHGRRDLVERQPQPGIEQDHADSDRDERLVERAQQAVWMHVAGRDTSDEARRQQHDKPGNPQHACDQLCADGQDEHEPEAEEDLIARHRLVPPPGSRGLRYELWFGSQYESPKHPRGRSLRVEAQSSVEGRVQPSRRSASSRHSC